MPILFNEKIIRSNTILYCDDYEQTMIFYRDILHLSINHKNDWMVEFILFDQTFLSVADAGKTTIKSSGGNGITISLKVENIDCFYEYLCDRGVNASEIKSVWEGRAFYIHDPEGHRIEFWT